MIAAGTGDGHVIAVRRPQRQAIAAPATKVAGGGASPSSPSRPTGGCSPSARTTRTATVWDVRSRTRVGDAFPVAKGLVPSVAFEPSGRLLITELGSAIEWPLDRPTLQRFACQVAGRDLTREEWADILPNRPYRRVCPA